MAASAAVAASRRVVTVFGATGAQGGSVAKALLDDGAFAVRAVTRNPSAEAATALAARGAEVIKADLSNKDEVAAAVRGSYGVFLVTQFWEAFNPDLELEQGKQVADACKAEGVEVTVYSSLEDTRPLNAAGRLAIKDLKPLVGDYIVPHFDAKGAIRQYMIEQGLSATFVQLSFYAQNLITMMKPQLQADGTRTLVLPMADKPMGLMDVSELGAITLPIFRDPAAHRGKTYGLANDLLTGDEIAATMSAATGSPFKYVPVSYETFVSFGFPGADDMGRMFAALYCVPEECPRDPKATAALFPGLTTFAQFCERNKAALVA